MAVLSPITRALLLASLLCSLTYLAGKHGLGFEPGAPTTILLKTLPVGLLALAALSLRVPGCGMLALVFSCYAGGDLLLEAPGQFLWGACSFALGHLVATIWLLRFRAPISAPRGLAAAGLIQIGLLVPIVFAMSWIPEAFAMIYGLSIALVTGALIVSRFPRSAAWGAVLFMISDTLIVANLNAPVFGDAVDDILSWSSYYAAQCLIFAGVSTGLRRTPA